jgi:hypothetical protein
MGAYYAHEDHKYLQDCVQCKTDLSAIEVLKY